VVIRKLVPRLAGSGVGPCHNNTPDKKFRDGIRRHWFK